MKNIKIMKKTKITLTLTLVLLPVLSMAQNYLGQSKSILLEASYIVGILVALSFTLALLYFFWGVAKYIRSEGQGKEEGRQVMVWGVVAMFVIASVWGIVRFIQREFNIDPNAVSVPIPTVQ